MVALRTLDYEPDPVPPGHGEPDPPHRFGRGSDVYTDDEWERIPQYVSVLPPYDQEDIPF